MWRRLDLETEMDDSDPIWRPDCGQRHRFLRPTFGQVQNCRESNVNQKTWSRHQSRAGVMYITHVPTKSTLGFYIKRNQRWNFNGVQMNLLDFENSKLKSTASMKRTSDHTTTTRNEHNTSCFEEIKIRSKPLICRAWSHNSLLWMLAVHSMDEGGEG